MAENRKKTRTEKFLIRSFVSLILFSVCAFGVLGFYMNFRSREAFHQIGEVYMSGVNKQMSQRFESIIQLRFDQVQGLVSVVSYEGLDEEELHEELAYRAKVRGFDYVALCSNTGEFETIIGDAVQPVKPGPFVEAVLSGEQRVAIGVDAEGRSVVLFGVKAEYPMHDGGMSSGLITAVPLSYISDLLALNDENQPMNYCIVRDDSSVVIAGAAVPVESGDESLMDSLSALHESASTGYSAEDFSSALKEGRSYDATVIFGGEEQELFSTPLPHSEWNLIAFMPYNQLNSIMEQLDSHRTNFTILACVSVLLVMLWIFVQYYRMSNNRLKELEVARQEAFEASKAKSEFLANMSHDIRTPMNAIVGMTAIARAHIDDIEQVKGCLKKIALSSKQLLGLINDILDMSKIESGKLTLSYERISLRDLFDGIVSVMQPQINSKKQSFDVHIENVETENVWCDGVRLTQVLLNLLSNATKYTPEGGSIRVSLSEEPSPKGDGYIRSHIVVKDNGIGMTPEFLERIYESYSRADCERVHKIEGAGLGMAITKYIVDAMEGSIEIESALGVGSEFRLTFDFEKANESEASMVLPSWNMLVVDDDEFVCKTTSDALRSIGVNADWTLDGEEAIRLAVARHQRGDGYEVILLDWKLPGIDGIQVARRLREALGTGFPILLISAYDWSEFENEAREAGISGFISKPLFKSTLYHALSQYCDEESEGEASEEQEFNLAGRRLLLAEDNEINCEVAAELLSDLGMELEWAEDGQICLDMFKKSEEGYYDAILMDLRMPHMNGYEATQAIRGLARPDAQTIPIIAMSADAFAEDRQRCLDCGMNAHVAKPIDVEEVAKLLERFTS